MKKFVFFHIISFFLIWANIGCSKHKTEDDLHGEHIDTLKVVTLYGPTSYFDYRDTEMGIDYENVKRFAEDEGMVLKIKTVGNISELIKELKTGGAHLAAYPVPLIAEYKEEVLHCGPIDVTHQVLVQKKGKDMAKDVTELVGKEITVAKGSKYDFRLQNLDEELGGGIIINSLENDTIVEEDLWRMVNEGKISYTVVDSDIANLYGHAFPSLDSSLQLSADQAASWAVAPQLDSLAARINKWENRTHTSDFVKKIYKQYYDEALSETFDSNLSYFKKLNLEKGNPVSLYDHLFKKYSSTSGYDWQLLAAIAFCESRYHPSIVSRFGASGLMQVMPATAKAMGVDPASLSSPEPNILAASRILNKLNKTFENRVENPEERLKFVVAAYNSGPGHIFDAMALAEKLGLDPQKWSGSVSMTTLMKARPEYYNDPVVKHGYFRGRETVDFVDRVSSIYKFLKETIPNK